MKKKNFITVMAVFDKETQSLMEDIQNDFEFQYGADTKTKGIPFHITLGSYAVEETDEIVSRIKKVAAGTDSFTVHFIGLDHFGNMVRYLEPVCSEELWGLHQHFASDYANGFPEWKPHATIYRHSEPLGVEVCGELASKVERLATGRIIAIELGEFFPPRKIIRVHFER